MCLWWLTGCEKEENCNYLKDEDDDMAVRPQRILSLCSGYGGLELGLEIAGMALQPLVYVEREVYAAANLVARMEDKTIPTAPIWDCVDTFDAASLHGIVDGIVGGYPCQPFSVAGRRRGVEDERHLWPHFARIIRECEPAWCFFENVSNHLRMGLQEVAEDLRAMGYRVAATLVTAEEVGAPHRRERLFILAHTNREPMWKLAEWCEQLEAERWHTELDDHCGEALANHNGHGLRVEWFGEIRNHGDSQHWDHLDRCGRKELADTAGQERRWREHQSRGAARDRRAGLEGGDAGAVFPPEQSPNDPGWENWPWPCAEPEIRQRLDGHPYWVDELRLNGGGVVPLQAAYAFSLLTVDFMRRNR